jgi:hypothetical protein
MKRHFFALSLTALLASSPWAMANSISAIGGDIEHYDLNNAPLGTLPLNKLPKLPIEVFENDEINGRVKVKLLDGSMVWLDNINLDLQQDSQALVTCKSANTGKQAATVSAVNMGFGNCKDVR